MLEEWLHAHVERNSSRPLQHQLYRALRDAIVQRRLTAHQRLPSTRELSMQLSVARNTVTAAYEQLISEGYLYSRHGAGCFVSDAIAETMVESPPQRHKKTQRNTTAAPSKRAQSALAMAERLSPRRSAGAFVPATPDLRHFALNDWQRLVRQHERQAPWQWLDYARGAGLDVLKQSIAQHVHVARAVNCAPEQVIITASTQQSFDLCFRLLADAGDLLALEDPGYTGTHSAALACDLRCAPIPVDDEGLQVGAIPPATRLVYVTPSHQYPLGVVMSLARRQALLQRAQRDQFYILEDDYDSELRFSGRPLASLQGLDENDRVFYLGTFSKVFFPALRLAYVIVPPAWANSFTQLHDRFYSHGQLAVQSALAEFISSGKLASHIRRLRETYRERNDYLRELLTPLIAQGWTLLGGDAGLHFSVLAPQKIDDVGIAERAAKQHITLRPLSPLYWTRKKRYGFMLGYAAADKRELKHGVGILLALLQE
jgi:GntR family transcriptional regulator/MocR family aminotransferase